MRKYVVATLQVEGIHKWPECPFEEVAFLKDPHRHIFHIKAVKSVEHNDREVEIIMLKRQILKSLEKFKGNFGRMSCEDLSQALIVKHKLAACEVLEDGENGALIWA